MAVHAAILPYAPLALAVHTRTAPAFVTGMALSLDWTHRFVGRQASDDDWRIHLLPALVAVGDAVIRYAPGRSLLLSGLCALPPAIALGTRFMATRGTKAAWRQPSPKRETQDWSLGAARQASGCQIDLRSSDTAGDDVAVLVSIASNVEPAFAASRPKLPRFRAILHVAAPGSYPHDLETPAQATDVAALVVEGLRRARDEYQARGTIHLFLAIPVGLAFLIGQSLNTAGPVQTYEHLSTDAVGRYQPAILLHPGS